MLYGSHYVLATLPIWATALIMYVLAIGVIYVLRDRLEGVPYDVAWSSTLGSIALITVVLIGATVLQRGGVSQWLHLSGEYHVGAFLFAVPVGVVWWAAERPPKWADKYHHLVVAPLFTYLGFTLLPAIFAEGTWGENFAAAVLVAVWMTFCVFDCSFGRLNQRWWLKKHGVTFRK